MQEHRVLIIEHDDRVCRVLGRIITRMGYAALAAADYDSFKAFYNEQVPAVILLNLEIAGNDNAEFCRYLVERKSPTAIILLSDREEDKTTDLMQLGLSAGLNMCGVLHKPVDVEAVKELLAGRMPRQPSSPLKKNYERGRPSRTGNRVTILDTDQRFEQPFCIRFDANQLINNRKFEVHRIKPGVTL